MTTYSTATLHSICNQELAQILREAMRYEQPGMPNRDEILDYIENQALEVRFARHIDTSSWVYHPSVDERCAAELINALRVSDSEIMIAAILAVQEACDGEK